MNTTDLIVEVLEDLGYNKTEFEYSVTDVEKSGSRFSGTITLFRMPAGKKLYARKYSISIRDSRGEELIIACDKNKIFVDTLKCGPTKEVVFDLCKPDSLEEFKNLLL